MKKRILATAGILSALVIGGLTTGYVSASQFDEKPVSHEKKEKMLAALDDRMKQVSNDLMKDGKVPNGYLLYDDVTIADVSKNSNWTKDQQDAIRDSSLMNINLHGVNDYYVPSIFVKPDGSEYAIGYKKVTGENEIIHYKWQDGQFVEKEKIKTKGIKFDKSLDELTQ